MSSPSNVISKLNQRKEQLNEIHSLGCADTSNCAAALLVLSELRAEFPDIACHFDATCQLLYLQQTLRPHSKVYIPIASADTIPLGEIHRLQARLAVTTPIAMALVDGNATIIYYDVSSGWQEQRRTTSPFEESKN